MERGKRELDSCTQVPVDVALKTQPVPVKTAGEPREENGFFKLLPVLGFERLWSMLWKNGMM